MIERGSDKNTRTKEGLGVKFPQTEKSLLRIHFQNYLIIYSEFISLVSDYSLLVGYEEEKASQQNHQATNTDRGISENKV